MRNFLLRRDNLVKHWISGLALISLFSAAYAVTALQLRAEAQTTLFRWGVSATHINYTPKILPGGDVAFFFVEANPNYYIWGRVVFSVYSEENSVIIYRKLKNVKTHHSRIEKEEISL